MKLLIVDDHAMVRAGLAALLRQPRYDVQVLQARNASEGIDMIRANSDIDVVLLDVSMPGMNGFEAVREFGRARPDLPIILLTASEDPADVRRGLAAGALGYVPKSSSPDTLMSAIRLVLSGEIYVPTVMLRGDDVDAAGTKATAGAPLPLTKRQTEVLQMLDRGLSNKAIGRELELSERTVKAHITAIFKSLRVTNRSEAVEFARRAALI
jgi:two-component system nitrate/nitrite response regulator NarL